VSRSREIDMKNNKSGQMLVYFLLSITCVLMLQAACTKSQQNESSKPEKDSQSSPESAVSQAQASREVKDTQAKPHEKGAMGHPSEPTKGRAEAQVQAETKAQAQVEKPASTGTQKVQIANPASVNCKKKGGSIEMMTGPDGQYGVCVFEDGSRCEEWRFHRGECKPGQCREKSGICDNKPLPAPVPKTDAPPPATGTVGLPNPASVYCSKNGGTLKIMDGPDGQYGVCIFKDGSRCEEWRFKRGECKPGQCREKSGMCPSLKKAE